MKVSLVPCGAYEYEQVLAAVGEALAPLGGMEAFVRPGQRVFVKMNMVELADHSRAVTTHPTLVRAVAQLAVQAGGIVTVGDCPGALKNDREVQHMYDVMGYTAAAEAAGARTEVCRDSRDVALQGYRTGQYACVRQMCDCDVLINLPKLKTHTLTGFTGAVKNLYGTVHGNGKLLYHAQFPAVRDFAAFLVDVAQSLRPQLNIMDAVLGHEGAGPTGGTPKEVGVILAAADAHALDWAAVDLMGWMPGEMPTLQQAKEYGLLDEAAIEYPLATPQQLRGTPFRRPDVTSFWGQQLRKVVPKRVQALFALKPKVVRAKCVGCGYCVGVCPAKAMMVREGLVHIDPKLCQRCFCCQELCPRKAIRAVKRLKK